MGVCLPGSGYDHADLASRSPVPCDSQEAGLRVLDRGVSGDLISAGNNLEYLYQPGRCVVGYVVETFDGEGTLTGIAAHRRGSQGTVSCEADWPQNVAKVDEIDQEAPGTGQRNAFLVVVASLPAPDGAQAECAESQSGFSASGHLVCVAEYPREID